MNIVSTMSTTRLFIWGSARMNVMTILYRPFQLRMRRSTRSTRSILSIRSTRKADTLAPLVVESHVTSISMMLRLTIVPSRQFQPSAQ